MKECDGHNRKSQKRRAEVQALRDQQCAVPLSRGMDAQVVVSGSWRPAILQHDLPSSGYLEQTR
jgi:hypothetical protein